MSRAVDRPTVLDAVANDAAAALLTARGELVDGAFEGIEVILLATHHDLEYFPVLVSTGVTFCHDFGSSLPCYSIWQERLPAAHEYGVSRQLQCSYPLAGVLTEAIEGVSDDRHWMQSPVHRVDTIEEAGGSVSLTEFSGEARGLASLENRKRFQGEMLDFLDEQIGSAAE